MLFKLLGQEGRASIGEGVGYGVFRCVRCGCLVLLFVLVGCLGFVLLLFLVLPIFVFRCLWFFWILFFSGIGELGLLVWLLLLVLVLFQI